MQVLIILIAVILGPPSFAKQLAKVSSFLSCFHILSGSLQAGGAVDKHMFFSNVSSSSNFLTWVSASSYASPATVLCPVCSA